MSRWQYGFWLFILILIPLFAVLRSKDSADTEVLTQKAFEDKLRNGRIVELTTVVNSDGIVRVKGVFIPDGSTPDIQRKFQSKVIYSDALDELIRDHCSDYSASSEGSSFMQIVMMLLPTVLLIAFFYFIFIRQMRSGGNAMSFGKSRARREDPDDNHPITFKDVAGCDEAKEDMRELVDYLKDPAAFGRLGGRIPRGVLLVGPPGTGKTSIGISIAKALNKKYYRFSVGGMRDEAEIKGHRRTYIGAMPGQVIKGLKVTKTKNPVFVIDEIDKMTVSNQGDPAAALLEVLDPEQNTTFRDHYLDIPFDISNVLFIVTANTTDTIPRPLMDRMECIELNGYTSDEKLHIGKKYLVPKSRAKHGLKSTDVKYTDKILKKIAEEYAREAGVRNFEKALDKIHRKVAMEIVENEYKIADLKAAGATEEDIANNKELLQRPVRITDDKLIKYLGQPIFHEDEVIRATRPGMSVGLAWTSMGGDVLAIEAQHIPGKGDLKLTGQLGDVMQESANIAFSYVKSIAANHGIDMKWFDSNNVHLHVPEGATPKDGPSAGITMATAIYSLITNQTMAQNMAMTGELSLLGKVMPIGGLKEKVLAARRNLVKTILIPKFNKRDLDKLEDNVKEGIEFHLVGDMEEVLKYAFPNDRYPYRENAEVQDKVQPSPEERIAAAVAKAVASVLGQPHEATQEIQEESSK